MASPDVSQTTNQYKQFITDEGKDVSAVKDFFRQIYEQYREKVLRLVTGLPFIEVEPTTIEDVTAVKRAVFKAIGPYIVNQSEYSEDMRAKASIIMQEVNIACEKLIAEIESGPGAAQAAAEMRLGSGGEEAWEQEHYASDDYLYILTLLEMFPDDFEEEFGQPQVLDLIEKIRNLFGSSVAGGPTSLKEERVKENGADLARMIGRCAGRLKYFITFPQQCGVTDIEGMADLWRELKDLAQIMREQGAGGTILNSFLRWPIRPYRYLPDHVKPPKGVELGQGREVPQPEAKRLR